MSTQLAFFSGLGEKDRILAVLAENHPAYLNALRSFAREIARERGTVTIDALRTVIAERDFPMPADIGADTRLFGTVFLSKEFEPVGQALTTRKERVARSGCGASYITIYRLRGVSHGD